MTQVELAKILGVEPLTVFRYLNDERTPEYDVAVEIAEITSSEVGIWASRTTPKGERRAAWDAYCKLFR